MKDYKTMVLDARNEGITNEQTMFRSIDDINDFLNSVKDAHEEEYNKFMRKTYETLYGCNYNECMAKEDVSHMWHTTDNGEKKYGEHWTMDEIESVWQDKVFPSGTTAWDKYVAAHIAWHDLSNAFDNDNVLKFAYQFFFCDEDFPYGKAFSYVSSMM